MKLIFAILFLLLAPSTFAADSTSSSEDFKNWADQYLFLGIYPTDLEARAEGKKLGLNDSQIAAFIDILHGEVIANVVDVHNKRRNLYSQFAIKAQSSKSDVTINIAKRVLSLLDDVNSEKESRNIAKFKVTDKKLREMSSILPKRIDAEQDAEKVIAMIDDMSRKQAPLESERTEITKQIDLFYKKESKENFDSAAFMKELGDKFNEHINRVNAELRR